MHGRVIQGFFPGILQPARADQARGATAQHKAAPGPAARAGAPAPAFAKGGTQQQAAAGAGGAAVQRFGNGSFAIDPAQIGLVRCGGTPLPQALLAKMEAAFNADFSAVRVHIGPQAPRIGALAFTTGNDLYFAPGQYQPDSPRGQQLIGHELAHVIQQRAGRVRAPGNGVAVVQDSALEAEADRLGIRAAAYRAPARMAAAVQRKPLAAAGAARTQRVQAKPGPPARPGNGRPANPRPAAIQRMPTSEARDLVDGWSHDPSWYDSTFLPTLMAIATKSKKTFEEFIKGKSIGELYALYRDLNVDPYNILHSEFFFDFDNKNLFVKSERYTSMSRIRNKEIYAISQEKPNSNKAIDTWRQKIENGTLFWHRGLPTTHFTYAVLAAKQILVGDGVDDLPTFSMGPPTRWIPGDQDDMTCVTFASYVNGQMGLQAILRDIDLVVGVILAMKVDPSKNPIAYLTASEQVVRGPVQSANLCIKYVVLRGPGGMQVRPLNRDLWSLPPPLPYEADKNDKEMIDAVRSTLLWMETNGFLAPNGTQRMLDKVY